MANLVIAVATMIIGFILAGYGAYTGSHVLKRSEMMSRIGSALEQHLYYVHSSREDLGRVPEVTDLVPARFASSNSHGIVYSYGRSGAYGYVCARAPAQPYMNEAMANVAEQRPGALYGSTCNTTGGPSGSSVAVTVRIN